ncbi:hypothetical protein [Rhodocyclus gracilis]|uniref:Uncharacterized protein n=1 Tax=Rhodocyclus tenuis TaxID=1066 RepID=A0A6L5JTN7_RHOTE|nr:hypothetical protein [Rhodocyclus gracilis]MQY50765.1 hypothetical protein [Rhodocyclus gracilis]
MAEMEYGLHQMAATTSAALEEAALYQDGLEALIGFLLAQLAESGRSPAQLLQALPREYAEQAQDDPHSPLLWPFERLEAQLRCQIGTPVETGMPRGLARSFQRLPGAPRAALRDAAALPGDEPAQ